MHDIKNLVPARHTSTKYQVPQERQEYSEHKEQEQHQEQQEDRENQERQQHHKEAKNTKNDKNSNETQNNKQHEQHQQVRKWHEGLLPSIRFVVSIIVVEKVSTSPGRIGKALHRATSFGSSPCLTDKILLPFLQSKMCPHGKTSHRLPMTQYIILVKSMLLISVRL